MAIAKQRIDKWLFFARVVKSRTLAGKLADGGKVRVNREKINSASHQLKVGDVLTIAQERKVLILKVVQLGERRGPYVEAKQLYEDLSPPPIKEDANKLFAASAPQRDVGAGRPTKRERRQIDKWRGRT